MDEKRLGRLIYAVLRAERLAVVIPIKRLSALLWQTGTRGEAHGDHGRAKSKTTDNKNDQKER